MIEDDIYYYNECKNIMRFCSLDSSATYIGEDGDYLVWLKILGLKETLSVMMHSKTAIGRDRSKVSYDV